MGYHPTAAERDERVTLPLPTEDAIRGLLAVKPDTEEPAPKKGPRTTDTPGE